ncbi:MAG TPA: hypothetical protein PKW17_09660 [Smithellaceae bacterium]|nr:hypothetical protein [Smithellaceae bacterium]HRS89942.1 hypothetical protein [Smithellaceae bacterium]
MEKKPKIQRIVFPAGIVLFLMVISINIYNVSRWWEPKLLHDVAANLSAAGMFLSIWLGAMIANTIAFFNGATFRERIFICLITPVIWSSKVLYDFIGIYSWTEFLYLFFHAVIMGPIFVALLCMGISEIWCRIIWRRRLGDKSVKIFQFKSVSVLVIGLIMTFLLLYNGGHSFYYLYMDIYTKLFF